MKKNHIGFLGLLLIFGAFRASAQAPENVAYVTNQDAGVTVIDLTQMQPVKIIDVGGEGPRGVALTPDGKYLLTANQKTLDVSVIDTATSKILHRIRVGKNPEFLRIMPDGSKAFVTYEPASPGGPPKKDGKEEEEEEASVPGHLAIIDLKSMTVVGDITGAPETEGIEFSADGKHMIVTNEGNDTLTVYELATNRLVKNIDISPHGSRPRGVKRAPDGSVYIVTLENSNNFLVLDRDYNVTKSVPTAEGPYGVAFDRSGKHIWVAAARGKKLQVFDAMTFAEVAAVPIGARCWHFSFTPDESKVLVACGRSDAVEVIDAQKYAPIKTFSGLKLPWGVVTYPKSYGSLDQP